MLILSYAVRWIRYPQVSGCNTHETKQVPNRIARYSHPTTVPKIVTNSLCTSNRCVKPLDAMDILEPNFVWMTIRKVILKSPLPCKIAFEYLTCFIRWRLGYDNNFRYRTIK